MRMKSAQQSRCFFFQQLALRRIEVKKAREIEHFVRNESKQFSQFLMRIFQLQVSQIIFCTSFQTEGKILMGTFNGRLITSCQLAFVLDSSSYELQDLQCTPKSNNHQTN